MPFKVILSEYHENWHENITLMWEKQQILNLKKQENLMRRKYVLLLINLVLPRR